MPEGHPLSSRREVLRAALLGAALPAASALAGEVKTSPSAGPAPAAPASGGRTFVLVHGAWHGGWCWRKLAPLLRQAGHAVYTPTLTGVGERAHLLTREVGLATHVEDVTQLLPFEDLRDVILVGHSYAGVVVSGAASAAAERIRHVVYLDAYVPKGGTSVFDNMSSKIRDRWRQVIAAKGEGWLVPPMLDAKAMGVTDAADAAWVDARLRRMGVRAFEEPVALDEAKLAKLERSYIRCAGFPGFAPIAQRAREQGWRVQEIPSGHDAMVAAPEALARALLAVA